MATLRPARNPWEWLFPSNSRRHRPVIRPSLSKSKSLGNPRSRFGEKSTGSPRPLTASSSTMGRILSGIRLTRSISTQTWRSSSPRTTIQKRSPTAGARAVFAIASSAPRNTPLSLGSSLNCDSCRAPVPVRRRPKAATLRFVLSFELRGRLNFQACKVMRLQLKLTGSKPTASPSDIFRSLYYFVYQTRASGSYCLPFSPTVVGLGLSR
jgi:hypothetical protein